MNNIFWLRHNKISYQDRARIPKKDEGKPFKPGLGISEDCCGCDTPCRPECVNPIIYDQFDQPAGFPPREHWTVDSGTWLQDGLGYLYLDNTPSSGQLHIFDPEIQGRLYLHALGEFESATLGATQRMEGGLYSEGTVSGQAYTLSFTVRELDGEFRVLFDLTIGTESITFQGEWENHPTFYLSLVLQFKDANSSKLTVCAAVDEETIIDNQEIEAGNSHLFQDISVGLKAHTDVVPTIKFKEFLFCGTRDYCSVSQSGYWTDNFDRFARYTHVYEDALGLPWINPIGVSMPKITPAGTIQARNAAIEYGAYVSHFDQQEQILGICSETTVTYPAEPTNGLSFAIRHGETLQFQIYWNSVNGWTARLYDIVNSTTYWSDTFEATGQSIMRLESTTGVIGQLEAQVFVDNIPLTDPIPITAVGAAQAGLYTLSQDATEFVDFEYFKTSVVPLTYCEPVDWTGTCAGIADPKFEDDFNNPAGPIGAPYTVVNGNGIWEYDGASNAKYTRTGGIGATNGWLELSDNEVESIYGTADITIDDQSIGGQALGGIVAEINTVSVDMYLRYGNSVGDLLLRKFDGSQVTHNLGDVNARDLGLYLCRPQPGYYQVFYFANGESFYVTNVANVPQVENSRRILLYSQLPNNFIFHYTDKFCTNVAAPEAAAEGGMLSYGASTAATEPLQGRTEPLQGRGTRLYILLVKYGPIPKSTCPRLYDLKSLDNYPAEWWNSHNEKILLQRMEREAKKLKVEFNESLCRRLIKIVTKRRKT